jgi:hypothetical protein
MEMYEKVMAKVRIALLIILVEGTWAVIAYFWYMAGGGD